MMMCEDVVDGTVVAVARGPRPADLGALSAREQLAALAASEEALSEGPCGDGAFMLLQEQRRPVTELRRRSYGAATVGASLRVARSRPGSGALPSCVPT